jgi:alcohol dehydrogenase
MCAGRRVLIIASAGALRRCAAFTWLPPGASVFTAFHSNPTVAQAKAAARLRHSCGADLVIGIGGGSALDVAKAARVLPPGAQEAGQVIAGRRPAPDGGPELLLVPTTAGTGSEVTSFATLYRGHRKASLDTPAARADIAVVDPALTGTCPPRLTWTCALDCLAHAIESLWSARSTVVSRDLAVAALRMLLPVLRAADELPGPAERDALSWAATLAGQAIAITRTTAAHAMSYPLTAHLGVPHGLACALNLTWLVPLVEAAPPEQVTDERGPAAVRGAVGTLRAVFGAEGMDLASALRDLIEARVAPPYGDIRWPRQPGAVPDDALLGRLVAEGMSSNRMAGTPVRLERWQVRAGLEAILHGVMTRKGSGCATTG